jgi:NAD(P)-dependent dehydrogenase (short-subunit alcohol dehydrogenase family)
MRLKGKVAVITGAGSGIGQATAVLFAQEGAKVGVADINAAGVEETVRRVRQAGGEVIGMRVDVAKGEDVQRMFQQTADAFGGIDVIFNNAGVVVVKSVIDTTESEWDFVLNVNLRGVWLGIKYGAPYLIQRGGGSIINTASVNALGTMPDLAAYAASKHGVLGLTRAAALDLGKYKIRVNCICPGTIDTPLHREHLRGLGNEEELFAQEQAVQPIGRTGFPEEIARCALFLASDESSFATGAPFIIDGGVTARLSY